MSDVVLVDSNILIYAHDSDAGAKRSRAAEKLTELWNSGAGRLSVQVLQEFFVNVTKKLATPVARSTAREIVSNYAAWVREPTTPHTVTRAIDIAQLAQISFWDALIVLVAGRPPRLLCTPLIVRTFDTSRAVGTRSNTHSILCLGIAAPRGLRRLHTILIRL